MARPPKQVKRFTCNLTQKTYDRMHSFADTHNLSYTNLTELALVKFISKTPEDADFLRQYKHKLVKFLAGGKNQPTAFSTNLTVNTMEILGAYSKNTGITKSVLTELALVDYMKKHSSRQLELE